MAEPLRIAVLASGAGSNLQALLDAITAGALRARVVGVFSDKARCTALQRARDAGVPAVALAPRDFADREAFDAALFAAVDASAPDLIVCAGYMRIISPAAVAPRSDRMINLHPSLLPLFKGLHTHQAALEAGVHEHGASVHVVTPGLDDGPVIAQARVPVHGDDDAATLAARVRTVEHPLLVGVVRAIAEGRLALRGGCVKLNGGPLERPLQLGANGVLA